MLQSTLYKRRNVAFSLVEAVIAVGIVAWGSTATISLLMYNEQQSSIETERERAYHIICDQLERAHYQLFTNLSSGTQVTVWDNDTPLDPMDDTLGLLTVIVSDPATGEILTSIPEEAEMVQVEAIIEWHPRGRLSDRLFVESAMVYLSP